MIRFQKTKLIEKEKKICKKETQQLYESFIDSLVNKAF